MVEINTINESLKDFNEASGQVINHEKLELFFNYNTPRNFKRLVQGALNMKQSQILGNYLCLPSSIGRTKASLFTFIEERTRFRVQG